MSAFCRLLILFVHTESNTNRKKVFEYFHLFDKDCFDLENNKITLKEPWNHGKIEKGTGDKLCVYTAKIGVPHYLEVTIRYEADDYLVFNNSNSLLHWYTLKDDGTEISVGGYIDQYTPVDKENQHVVKYLLDLWGDGVTNDIYLKRTSNMKCGTKASTNLYYLEITVVPWLPFWEN